jgi:hypothetical protein
VQYRRQLNPVTSERIHVVTTNAGDLLTLGDDDTWAPLDAGNPQPFPASGCVPSFAILTNVVVGIMTAGPAQVFTNTAVWRHGFSKPGAPTLTPAGGGDLPADDYDVCLTWYDAVTGLESSRGPFTTATVGALGTLTVDWTAYAGDHPLTATRVYVRQTSKQTAFFLAATITAGTETAVLSLTQDQLDILTILAPGENQNNQLPASGIVGGVSYLGRLFVHNGQEVFWSNLNQPEAFDSRSSLKVNPADGQRIVALFPAPGRLLIFKQDALWTLEGEDPKTWQLRLIDPQVGALSVNSILAAEGRTYWWSEQGPMVWDGAGQVRPIGAGRIDPLLAEEFINYRASQPLPAEGFVGVVGTVDVVHQRLLWALPGPGQVQNNKILSFKYRLGAWETEGWEAINAASLITVEDAEGVPRVSLGGYKGQVFRYGGTFLDGVPSGAVFGTIQAATSTTVETEGGLLVDGAGLAERYVQVVGPGGLNRQRKRLASNTATVLTLAAGELFDPVPTEDWTWSVGEIAWDVWLPWSSHDVPFRRKRYEYFYALVGSNYQQGQVEVQVYRDFVSDAPVRTLLLTTAAVGLVWDEGKWDERVWGTGLARTYVRKRVAKTGWAYRVRFRSTLPNQDVVLFRTDMRAELGTDKR